MSSIKQINKLIADGQSLELIAQSLGEIAAVRLSRIKSGVERNRNFFAEITQIYVMVKLIARERGIIVPSNGKTISVLLSSNSQFSGKINTQLAQYFAKNTSQFSTDRIVVGKTGVAKLQNISPQLTFKSMIFKEDLPSYDELKSLADAVKSYKKVLLHYIKLETMLSQKPAVVDITAGAEGIKANVKQLSYIFEPEIKMVLSFFDTQINILLLEQALLESELSRVANRLISMSQAQDRAESFLAEQKTLLAVSKRSLYNLRLLESLISQVKFKRRSI